MEKSIYKDIVILGKEIEYLKNADPILGDLIDVVGEVENKYIPDPFIALINSIVYQSISFKAATTIWNRVVDLIVPLEPSTLLSFTDEEIRVCGLSRAKVEYIKNISRAFKENEIRLDFDNMSNDEISEELLSIKGIGKWTVQMFLTFSLVRKDVISYGDLAIRRGMEKIYSLDHDITLLEFKEIEKRYSPYSTIAALYLWEITLRKLF